MFMTDIPFRSVLDSVADGVLICTAAGKIAYANAPARRALGNGQQMPLEGLTIEAVLDLSQEDDLADLARASEPVAIRARPRHKPHAPLSIRASPERPTRPGAKPATGSKPSSSPCPSPPSPSTTTNASSPGTGRWSR
jgi:PAS domain-containing protein